MLRIAMPAQGPADMPLEQQPVAPATPDMPSQPRYDAEKATPQAAGYLGSEAAPNGFECEHCIHWLDPNACNIVSGNIDPEGCCNLFQDDGSGPEPDENNDQDTEVAESPEAAEQEPQQ